MPYNKDMRNDTKNKFENKSKKDNEINSLPYNNSTLTNFNIMTNFVNRSQASKLTGLSYLGSCGSSAKIVKNLKVLNVDTYVLYLAPWKLSGFQVCSMATKDCIEGCLNTSGRAGMEINSDNPSRIIASRIAKTRMLFEQRDFFMNWLVAEITAKKAKSVRDGNEFAVRLNGTSDINWSAMKLDGKTVFELFPNIQFYDYTKVPNRFNNVPANYHLTFSYTGYNWSDCEKVLNAGHNVAVVFNLKKTYNMRPENIKPLPTKYKGFKVLDGDVTDYRPMDNKGHIVGLRFKTIADKDTQKNVKESKFVVQPDDKDCAYAKRKRVASATF